MTQLSKKKMTIIALNQSIARDIEAELENIFGSLLEIQALTVDQIEKADDIKNHIILCHDPKVLLHSMHFFTPAHTLLMTKRTILRSGIEKLQQIPDGKRCLVINMTEFSILETITAMYQLGINHIQFIPYDWSQEKDYDVDYIIAPLHFSQADKIDAETVLIGHRPLEISTLLDIIAIADIDAIHSEKIIKRQLKQIPTFWKGVINTLTDKRVLYAYLNILFDEFSEAIIVCDETKQITMINNNALDIFKVNRSEVTGQSIDVITSFNSELQFILSQGPVTNKVIHLNGHTMIINVHRVHSDDMQYGSIILIEEFNQIMDNHQSIRKQVIDRGHIAKFKFNQIIGKSDVLMNTIETCKVFADSDATILLTGESGTGKEMFSSSIHNHSNRSKEPYVAINCATLPESILESELFGYEEGAFTGAKKGGKIGLFEQAHKGTLFMDEIGELPLSIQARLLRALQEKEIIRVGGGSIINVNTRIIAATNRDLKKMVELGEFRRDLYFRLNVFQVPLPALSERSEDIEALIEFKLTKTISHVTISDELKQFFKTYDWPGNIRELFNILEYMMIFGHKTLNISHLPPYLKTENMPAVKNDIDFMIHSQRDKQRIVLKSILELESNNKSTGRRSILAQLKTHNIHYSEGVLRHLLAELSNDESIVIKRGRGGCKLTEKGIEILSSRPD